MLLATVVSTLSEYGSESAFEKLQEESETVQCRVKRERRLCLLSLEELVVNDIVFLQSGERVPADGIVLQGTITVDQSALNGESKETKKQPGPNKQDTSPTAENRVFRGSVVCSGNAVMRVTAVGDQTLYGSVATEVQEETRESPLKIRLSKFTIFSELLLFYKTILLTMLIMSLSLDCL